MNTHALLQLLEEKQIQIHADGGELVIRAPRGALDPALVESLRSGKAALLAELEHRNERTTPVSRITPDMLPLVKLPQDAIDAIVAKVEGGAANVQDIYPLGPLQEGLFFHYLLQDGGDPYLLSTVLRFDTRARLDGFVAALQEVIDRHDILRTGFVWEGLDQPVQVVWRRATLSVQQVELDAQGDDAAGRLEALHHPSRYRLDVGRAPLLTCYVAPDDTPAEIADEAAGTSRGSAGGPWLLHLLAHHLISDHTTLDLLVEEARMIVRGERDRLPRTVPFRNFVAQACTSVGQDDHDAFFRSLLGDIEEPTAPFGVVEVRGDGRGHDEVRQMLDPAISTALRRVARAMRVSAASLVHLAWALVLARTTGRRNVVFGTLLFGRMQSGADADRALGMFLNTLPMRVDVGDDSVRRALERTHATLVQLLRHEHASLALAQRASGVPAKTPLFTSLLNYRHSDRAAVDRSGQARYLGDGIALLRARERTNYPLSVDVDDLGDGFHLTAQADASIGAARLCDYMVCALTGLVQALEGNPDRPVRELEVLPEPERVQIIEAWSAGGEAAADVDACIHERFEQQAALRPDAIALAWGDRRLRYGELNAQANRLAHHLRAMGVRPDDRVAVYGPRSAEIVVAVLAVLKAGGAYVPLDPSYPLERLGQMVEDCGPRVMLHVGPFPDAVARHLPRVDLQADAAWQHESERNPDRQTIGLGPQHLAYVLYTSGSTGRPKGVMIEHRGVVNQNAALAERIGLGPGDRVLQFASLSFDTSVEELFATWMRGATLVMRTDEWLAGPRTFWALCEAHGVTVVDLPTQFWAQLALDPEGASIPVSVRQVIIGGEAVTERALAAWFARDGHRPRLLNTYGPTETTISATMHEAEGRAGQWRIIGRPSAGVRVYLVDRALRPVPAGVAGEIVIGGVQVGRGYLNQPALTAERFLDTPSTLGASGARLYRTGDVGRWRPDGTIEYLGRDDNQVKIRGFRIELGEIEAALAKVTGVTDVVVVARAIELDGHGDQKLVAYFVGDAAPDAETLRQHVAQHLPAYMVPSAYVRLAALPLSPTGKLDRRALPAPDADAHVRRSYDAPRSGTEQLIATIWEDLLQLEQVGRRDDFFALGGHSLLAVRLLARLRRTLDVEISLADLFAHTELWRLAEHLAGARASSLPPIRPAARTGPLPLSLAQQRLWFLTRVEGASAAYHLTALARLTGPLDRPVLIRALRRVVERHEALRTRFRLVDDQPVQIVEPGAELPVAEDDLRGASDAAARALELVKAHACAPFDLAREIPVRALVVRVSEDEHLLQVVMHHIASDGWSVGVLLDELGRLYPLYLAGESDPLPPLAIQYADYAAWQRAWFIEGELERQRAYWHRTLGGAPILLELPTTWPRPSEQAHAGDEVGVSLDAALVQRLRTLCRRHGVTPYMAVLASWAATLGRLAAQHEVVIGTPVAGRDRAEIEPLVGFFVNTLPIRIDLQGAPTVAELLARTRAQVLSAHEHQDLPFDQIVEAVAPPRSLAHTPLFQVMLAWQSGSERELCLPGVTVTPLRVGQATAQFDLTLSLEDGAHGITGTLNYATALFDRATAQRLVAYWETLLEGFVADGEAVVARLPILPEAERLDVVERWNQTRGSVSRGCVHEQFEAQVRRNPEAIALVHGAERVSYGALNAAANRLAHHLRGVGVGPEHRVAICLERGVGLVTAILAVLKAGGAYVPLDPAYASERLVATLADSDPSVVLVDATGRGALGEPVSGSARWVDIERDAAQWAEADERDPGVEVSPSHLAYVIYTSGSTGRPKGVMVEHAQVSRLFASTEGWFGFDERDVWSLFHSIGFDFSVWELWGALSYGGRLVVVPLTTARSPAEFYELLCAEGVTVLNQTPSAFQHLMGAQAQTRSVHQLRWVIFGGEALELRTLKPWYERNDEQATRLVNMYGITETTVHVTYRALAARDAERPGPSPIGVKLPDLRLYVLDEQRQPVAVGVTGELYVGGAGVARGYLGQPELTAERFIDDPFTGTGRLYRTGDLGRWLPDGSIEYLGRNDFQVKIRGFRIELGEIEARLAGAPGVAEVVVAAQPVGESAPGERRLVAYYTGEHAPDARALREHAARGLPDYMLPAAYVRLAALPLTPNGKLDRKALPAPQGEAFARRSYEPPQGPVEERLAMLWARLLKQERVGRHDNFFALGGHSLLAVSLLERMRREGLHGDVRAVFKAQTLAELAAQVRNEDPELPVPPNLIPAQADRITPEMLTLVSLDQDAIDAIVASVDGGAANVQDIYPLAPLQEGMLFHHRLDAPSETDPYMESYTLAFRSRGRLERFLAALQHMVDRHDILRTGFWWDGLEQPVQVVRRRAVVPVSWLDPDELGAVDGDVVRALEGRFDPRRLRIDIQRPPLLACHVVEDRAQQRWVLCILMHHLVIDNTTLKLLAAEERAIELGRLDELPRPAPYREFVARARQAIRLGKHAAFFRELLGDIDEPTAPFGLVDVRGDGRGIAEVESRLPAELSRAIRRCTARLGVSPASFMHQAFGLVLARVTGRRDVVFGTVLFGRMHAGAQADRVMGMFINTLPMRIRVDERGVEDSLRRTHDLVVELLRYEHTPLGLAQRESRVPAQTPLFSALLNYRQGALVVQEELDDASAPPDPGRDDEIDFLGGNERTNYPLVLSIDDMGDDFSVTAQVSSDIGPARVWDFMHEALAGLVRALDEDPRAPTCGIDVLPAAERERVVVEWNDTARAYPLESCVHELFEAQVARSPAAIAVAQGDEAVSYAALDARANRLAWHLRQLGVRSGARVALCFERSPALITAMLATAKAGGAYVPLDPAYPAERLETLLRSSAPAAVLTDAHARLAIGATAQRAGVRVLDLDRDVELDASARRGHDRDDTAAAPPTSSDLAYVIYTSGSTGEPKGVMVEHRSLTNLVAWHTEAFGLAPGHRSSSTAGVGFDALTWEIWPPLCSGGTLLLPPRDVAGDPERLLDWWRAQALDVSFLVTPLAELAHAGGTGNPRLQTLLIGGDRLRRWPQGLPSGQALINNYGPTESCVVATSGRLHEGDSVLHIGRPIANVRVYVVDASFRPSPVGVVGEIVIGGAGVGRGYLGEPGLTAERFVDDPFVSGGRVYRTGDLGRWRADGTIEYVGRNDFQVKLRGYRIELGEIEARLGEVSGVDEVVVVARREGGEGSDARLVAYYTGEGDLGDALRAHASRSLPSYMVPTAYVSLAALPLTAHGKLDRGALPAPEASEVKRGEAPRNQIEEILAGLWSELLGREQVSRSDDFFELGGHSLLAMQLVSRVRRLLGVELALSELFAHPELHRLAARVRVAERTALPEIAVGERRGPEPVSLMQQRLWFLTRLEGASAAYHIRGAFRLRGVLDRGALLGALRRIVERHESLRTRFGVRDGVPVQEVQDVQATAAVQLREQDVRGSADAAAAARALGDAHAATAFELSEELPLRVLVVRTGEDEHVLEVVMHHIASDGWSVGIFLRELSALYAAYASGRGDPLPAPTVQYADWASWQRSTLASGQLARQSEFWRSNLCGAPSLLSLPWDRPRPAQQDPAGASIDVEVGAELTRGLRALSRRHGVTMFMTLLASWGAVLSRLSGQEEVVIGSPVAGRGRAEIESLIGFFVNTLALRIDLQGEPTVSEVLGRTRAQVLAAQEHQDLPFDQVVEVVAPPRSLSHTPLYQVMLDWHSTRDAPLTLPGLQVTTLPTELDTAQCDLTLALQEGEEGLVGSLNYATALFERETVERYRGYWLRVLEGMVADDRQPIGAIAVLSPAEWRRVVVEWNDTGRALPLERCVHELFEAQVARAPEAVAVDDGTERVSYGELNRRANRLARHLREVGVTADARVGVCAERGAAVLVALLATLKAGGAYVPLDPAYPDERLAHIIEDSAPVAVLTAGAGREVARRHVRGTVAVVDVELDAGQWASRRDDDLDARAHGVGAEHLAYVIYTSGSSGQPKGVMIEHRNLVNYTLAAIEWFGLGPADTVLQQNSLNFDLSLEEIMPALLAGARLLPRSRPFGAGDEGERASVVHLTAAHWHSLVGEWSRPGAGAPPLDGVRMMNVTGDALSPHALGRWEALGAETRLINTYGPTEVTVSCSAAYVRHEAGAARVSIGKPFANTRMYVLDRRGEPVPVGVVGELFIAGAQVGRGYLHQPQRSAERFVEDRFHPGERMYRSGDLARWRPDGELEFIGRDDGQVKVRGFRVELGEVESALAQLPGLDEVAVLLREDVSGDKRLVAYYTGAAALDDDALRRHAAEKLPAYMLPAAYVRLAALPLTPNGKLDRKALPAPDDSAASNQPFEAPCGEVEERLARIWSELLELPRVGRHDDFFALGGHSLLAVRLIERMRHEDLHADVTSIFTAVSLAELARATTRMKEILL
ncbi:amino acid adenylation domain-containing protein [Sorangium sp. So ce321]|uniref:amino acid adenylation domain-containing protein n=1 Tax=Sorangium sp. So ce321 TaxID=3133300 RepID=UPI003F5E69A7